MHLETLTTLYNLGIAYLKAGKTAEAIALFEKVRDAFIIQRGPDHPHTLAFLQNLEFTYRDAGKLPEAIELLEQVRDARVKKLGTDHLATLTTLNSLAAAYWSTNQLEKSAPLFEEVLTRREAKLGRQHPDTKLTVTLAQFGLTLLTAKAWIDAEQVLRECLTLREKLATGDNPAAFPWQVANTKSMLGESMCHERPSSISPSKSASGVTGCRTEARLTGATSKRLCSLAWVGTWTVTSWPSARRVPSSRTTTPFLMRPWAIMENLLVLGLYLAIREKKAGGYSA